MVRLGLALRFAGLALPTTLIGASLPLVWGPGDARADAPLTDLFARDEFHLNVARSR